MEEEGQQHRIEGRKGEEMWYISSRTCVLPVRLPRTSGKGGRGGLARCVWSTLVQEGGAKQQQAASTRKKGECNIARGSGKVVEQVAQMHDKW